MAEGDRSSVHAPGHDGSNVFHNNGYRHESLASKGYVYFWRIVDQLLRDESRKGSATRCDLEIVICHNYRRPGITERTLAHLGADRVTVLGRDVREWSNTLKLRLVADHLRHSTAAHVLHLDGGDVAVCDDPARILAGYLELQRCRSFGVLFAAEKESYPDSTQFHAPEERAFVERIERFERATHRGAFRHLNSGCYIGRREDVRRVLERAWSMRGVIRQGDYAHSDQILLREVHRRAHPEVAIDSECAIFQCLFMIDRKEVRSPYPLSPSARTRPMELVRLAWKLKHRLATLPRHGARA